MVNLKHAASAIAAVAMVGSLAANQASNITPVNAQKSTIQFNQPEILAGDGEGVVLDLMPQLPEVKTQEPAPVVVENKKRYVLITESFLNLRAEASTEAEIIAQLECAAEVTLLSEENDWYYVQFEDKTGYVSKQYITESYEEAKASMLDHFKYESGTINADGVNIRDGFGAEGTNVIDQTDSGDLVFIIERSEDGWLKVYYGKNYDIGYVKSDFVTVDDIVDKEDVFSARANRINSIVKKGIVSSNGTKLNVRVMPDDNAAVIDSLNDGEEIRIISKGSKWTKIAIGSAGNTAYVKTEFILDEEQVAARELARKEEQRKKEQANAKAKTSQNTNTVKRPAAAAPVSSESTAAGTNKSGQAIVNAAQKYIGTRYVYGGTSPSTGFDCSGLVQYACRQVGISVNRSSSAQYSNGVAVSKSDLQPGDLVFFSKGAGISHVVIYAGNGQVIHAPRPGKTVCYTTLANICSYSTYVGARRVA